MKKKILIGSIIAVALLTLVSFSSVVGYSSVKSDSKIASPLFNIRTNRATHKEENVINNNYIGKNRDIGIFFIQSDKNLILVEELIERINDMDEGEIENLLMLMKKQLPKNKIKNLDKEKLINVLIKIKNNPHNLKDFDYQDNPIYYTMGEPWYPGCFFTFITVIIIGFVITVSGFFALIYGFTHPTTILPTCDCPWS